MKARVTIYSKTGPFVSGHRSVRDKLMRVPGQAADVTDHPACADFQDAFSDLHHDPIPAVGLLLRVTRA